MSTLLSVAVLLSPSFSELRMSKSAASKKSAASQFTKSKPTPSAPSATYKNQKRKRQEVESEDDDDDDDDEMGMELDAMVDDDDEDEDDFDEDDDELDIDPQEVAAMAHLYGKKKKAAQQADEDEDEDDEDDEDGEDGEYSSEDDGEEAGDEGTGTIARPAKKRKVTFLNNTVALLDKLNDIRLPSSYPWVETLQLTTKKSFAEATGESPEAVHDDLKREAALSEQQQDIWTNSLIAANIKNDVLMIQ